MLQRTMRGVAGGAAILVVCIGLASCDSQPTESAAPSIRANHIVGNVGHFYVCKEGTDASFDVSGGDVTTLSLTDGECEDVKTASATIPGEFTVTVTEQSDPTSYVLDHVLVERFTVPNGDMTSSDTYSGPGITERVSGDIGVIATFYNDPVVPPPPPPPPPPPADGRFTGGGSFFLGDIRFTHGFELRCDYTDHRQNLEINWLGNQFHLTELTYAECSDDPAIEPHPPRAGLDTYYGEGVGRLNQVDGATITFTITDAGEPGTGDTMEITITPLVGSPIVVPVTHLNKGNHQAHDS